MRQQSKRFAYCSKIIIFVKKYIMDFYGGKIKEGSRSDMRKAKKEARKSQTGVEKMDKLMGSGVLAAVPVAIGGIVSQFKKRRLKN